MLRLLVLRVTADLLLALCVVSPLVFVAMLWLTRAGGKRAMAALAGCATAAVFSLGWDALAARMGWWTYPYSGELLTSLTVSMTMAFLFGGVAGLAGWRMMRAMGRTGAVTFLAGFVGLGLIRDQMLELNTTAFAIGEGPMPHVMGGIGYLTIAVAVQVTMFVLAGPPTRDSLRTD